jgi:protein-S-isoprenylcysteine O-methyltransferase Ste14
MFTFSPKVSKIMWLAYTFLSISAVPTLMAAFPDGTTIPKWAVIAIAGVNSMGALLRLWTTNSFVATLPEIPAADKKPGSP